MKVACANSNAPDEMLGEEEFPLVTVALFAYKQQDYVERAAASVLCQTYPSLEIILSDDCSPDDTFDRLAAAAKSYRGPHRVLARRNDVNLGLCGHVQKIGEIAQGRILVVAAGDDVSQPDRVARLVDQYRSDPAAMLVYSDVQTFRSDAELPAILNTGTTKDGADIITLNRYVDGEWFPVAGASASYDVRLFRDFRPIPNDAIYEDSILLFRALLLGHMVRLNEVLVWYRAHAGQISNTYTGDPHEDLRKRKRLASAAVVVARQQLNDYAVVRSRRLVDRNWRLNYFLLKRYWFYRAQDAAYRWAWPYRICVVPLLFVLRGRAKAMLGLRELASFTLPEWIYLTAMRRRAKQRSK